MEEKARQLETSAKMKVAGGAYEADIRKRGGAFEVEQMRIKGAEAARNLELQKLQGLMAFESGQYQAELAGAHASRSGLSKFFSDISLKHNIVFIKKSPSGLKIYNFEYKDSKLGEGVYQGVMSHEIPQEAVIKHPDGYDMVDYSKIDVDFIKIKD